MDANLRDAASSGDNLKLKRLLADGANVNSQNKNVREASQRVAAYRNPRHARRGATVTRS